MEKITNKLFLFLVFLICVAPFPASAASYSVYTDFVENEQELLIAPADAIATASDAGAAVAPYTLSYSVYDDGMISSSYLDYAKGFLQYVKPGEDYVFARTGQYQYIFAHGDWDGGFSGEATVYKITVSSYGNTYSFDSLTDSNFSLSVGSGLVYSSVAPYPALTGSDFSYGLLLCFCFYLMCNIWSLVF